jgi:hypothetical protein
VERMIAQGKANPDDRFFLLLFTFRGGAEHACCCACYVPVLDAAGSAFCQPVQIDEGGSL